MRPDGLNTLSVGHPNPIHVGEIEVRLTRYSMIDDMELGDCNTERMERAHVNGRHSVVVRETALQIFPPLTANIVGDDNVGDPGLNIICKR